MKLLCMAFDGATQLERESFDTVQEVWDYADSIGSKWYFYPFYFVVTDSGKTIKDTPKPLEILKGKRVSTVKREFEHMAFLPEANGMDVDTYTIFASSYFYTLFD